MPEIIALAEQKYGPDFNGRLFLEQLVSLDDVHDTKIVFLAEPVSKAEIENFLRAEIRNSLL